ncbi:MAG: phenylalanine--tRNA ligase subunit beta [Bacilli bacterium]
MAISLNWINDYVDVEGEDFNELASKITKAGINVEAVNHVEIKNLVIGQVEQCFAHPDSDHLKVCKVNVGSDIKQIVCGALNVREKIKVIVALPGAILPGNFEIKKGVIRGVESDGMICALFELGLEEKTKENYDKGILELDANALVGQDALKYLESDDTTFELDLNPNRSDCNNHIPFAYEVAAVLNKKVTLPNTSVNPVKESINGKFELSIDTENCSMYNAKMVKEITVGESPLFIKKRLEKAGMRSINNVVDISNYVMLEYGQPLHFFDYDKLGNQVVVRMACDNEKIITLDGKNRLLCNKDIVITDGTKPVCIAGVMGSIDTEVDNNTKIILIESAIFNPYNVRYTSINLDLRSEASLRYEKGLNYEYCDLALDRACYLLEKYAGGKVLNGVVSYDKTDKKIKKVDVSISSMSKLLGMPLTDDITKKALTSLGFNYETIDENNYTVYIPNRRLDISLNEADIAEEIGRISGYDKIISALPSGIIKSGKYVGNVKTRKLISKRLRSLGLNECRTYTLVSSEDDNVFTYDRKKAIKLLKPMSSDKSIVRQTIVPSLLRVVNYNKKHGIKDAFLYEISNVYSYEMNEDTKVAIAIKGKYINNNFNLVNVNADFYLLKGIIENVLEYLGFKNRYVFEKKEIDGLHPGISAIINVDKEEIGYFGKIHPSISKDDVYVCEFSMIKLISKKIKPIKYKEVSKYPSINKDVAFIVDKSLTSEEIIKVIKKAGSRLLTEIEVFDVYTGEKVDEDKKSIAFSLTFQDDNKTLTDLEINEVFNNIIKKVTETFSATLRDN